MKSAARGTQVRGMTMVEMLVTIILVSIGLLGLMGVLARVQQSSTDAEDRARAATLAATIAGQMMMNHSVAVSDQAKATWNTALADQTNGGLPSGAGQITPATDNDTISTTTAAEQVALITITWQSPHASSQSTYTTKVVVP